MADSTTMPAGHRQMILASGLGAMFEWYDFYLYGVLAPVLALHFFSAPGEQVALVVTLLAFAAGFVVRPVGALVFGRLGDMIGRKYTFLMTLLLMGGATFVIGLLPDQETIGVAAPIILVVLRLLQGLAIGGEYGGVATYVAEHAPANRRGFYTGFIQATASMGLLLALLVVVGLRTALGEQAFSEWGWRLPFLFSVLLLVVGIWVRLNLKESPIFWALKHSGGASRAPLNEAFARWDNLRQCLIALFGLLAAQAVVWYTGQFQALYFMTLQLRVDAATASLLMSAALALAVPLFVGFGALSDRVGRKPIILIGAVAAAASYFPLFEALTRAGNPALAHAQQTIEVKLSADATSCAVLRFDAVLPVRSGTDCGAAKRWLSERAVRYTTEDRPGPVVVGVGAQPVAIAGDGEPTRRSLDAALDAAGYPSGADPAQIDRLRVIGILFVLVLFVSMVYGPMAAMLTEMFPTRVRCSSVSLPYHIGNGWFGGLLPSAVLATAVQTGNVYGGLWIPIVVALAGSAIGLALVRETRGVDLAAIGTRTAEAASG